MGGSVLESDIGLYAQQKACLGTVFRAKELKGGEALRRKIPPGVSAGGDS